MGKCLRAHVASSRWHGQPCGGFFRAVAAADPRARRAVFIDDLTVNVGRRGSGFNGYHHTDTATYLLLADAGGDHMTLVTFDIRANHATGVARYGESVLAAPHRSRRRTRFACWSSRGPPRGHGKFGFAYGHQVVAMPGDDGFVRRSSQLRGLLASGETQLFHTSHYIVDRSCPVPFSFTIHDLTRWRFPEMSYSDESFTARFGVSVLRLLEQEIGRMGLGPWRCFGFHPLLQGCESAYGLSGTTNRGLRFL